jgi:hypothetical protein
MRTPHKRCTCYYCAKGQRGLCVGFITASTIGAQVSASHNIWITLDSRTGKAVSTHD